MRYEISLMGCDDTTTFDINLTADQAALVRKIAAMSLAESEYGCMPIMSVAVAS